LLGIGDKQRDAGALDLFRRIGRSGPRRQQRLGCSAERSCTTSSWPGLLQIRGYALAITPRTMIPKRMLSPTNHKDAAGDEFCSRCSETITDQEPE
jgi:hypothetical protein